MSIPELSESFATFEGPCRGWWTVSAELVMGCRDDVDQCLKTLSGAGCIEKIEIEFYDALHYLVNPIRRAGAKERERLLAAIGTGMTQAPADRTHTAQAELFQAINALHVALNGIAPLNHELASKYHPYGVVGASSVQGVAGWLSALLPMWNALAHSVSSRSLDEHGIYPGGWEEWGEAGRAHLQQKLKELREFYGRAAEAGACIIVGPSGAQLLEMQTMWAAEARQPQQNVSSGGYWFDGKTGGDREIDCTCRRCGFEFTFDPFQGERPPAKCPTCGTS
jgi:hypothetical protein